MGYYTDYDLQVYPYSVERKEIIGVKLPDGIKTSIAEEVDKMRIMDDGNVDDGYFCNAKWYNYGRDMCLLSLKFPTVLFELHGSGEDPEDIWFAYFHAGKMQYCPGQIAYDEFDCSKLKKPRDPVKIGDKYVYEEE